MFRAWSARSSFGDAIDDMSTVPLIPRGLLFTPVIVKLSNLTTLSVTGILSSEKRNGVPSISTLTVVVSKSRNPLNMGLAMSPVMSISPLSTPERLAVPCGRNGFATERGNLIILKSSRNGCSAVESLRLPVAVIALTPLTISDVLARIVPAVLVLTSSASSKSPTFFFP